MDLEIDKIITQKPDESQSSWQKELANVVTDPQKLLEKLSIDPDKYRQHFSARK